MTISTKTHKALLGVLAVAVAMVVLVLPYMTRAAYNDVTLTTSVTITVGSVDLTISGSSALLEQLDVTTTTVAFQMEGDSTVKIESAGRFLLGNDAPSNFINEALCTSSESTLKLVGPSGAAQTTVTVTPSQTTTCGGGGSSSGGGGGGGSIPSTTTTTTTTTDTTTTTATTDTTTSTDTTAQTIAQSADPELKSLIELFITLGIIPADKADAARSALANTAAAESASSYTFIRDLDVGSTSNDVMELQKFLNANGYTLASTGAGSPGNETSYFGPATRSALAKYQAANDISPAVGYFGPLTRASVNATGGTTSTGSTSSPQVGGSAVFTSGLAVGDDNADVMRLQQLLNSNSETRVAASGVGSAGNETTYFGSLTEQAVQKFQVKYGVAGPGEPGYGYVGPATRAKLLEVFGN